MSFETCETKNNETCLPIVCNGHTIANYKREAYKDIIKILLSLQGYPKLMSSLHPL